MFGVAATLTAIGAVSPAAVAIVAPIALGFAAQYRINPLLMGVLVVHGAQAGGFSPISVYGSIVNGVVADNGLPQDEVFLFFASLAVNLLIAAVVFVAFGGLKLLRATAPPRRRGRAARPCTAAARRSAAVRGSPAGRPSSTRSRPRRPPSGSPCRRRIRRSRCSAWSRSWSARSRSTSTSASSPSPSPCCSRCSRQAAAKEAVGQITWSVVLLICGVLTYVGVLEQIGTIDYVGDAVADVGAPLIAALLLCYIGAIVSAFASSVGVLGRHHPAGRPVPADRRRRCGRLRGRARDRLDASST